MPESLNLELGQWATKCTAGYSGLKEDQWSENREMHLKSLDLGQATLPQGTLAPAGNYYRETK